MRGGPHGSILVAYYECGSIKEAAEQALALLDDNYEVTVYSGGYYNPRSYTSKERVRQDFRKCLEGTDGTDTRA